MVEVHNHKTITITDESRLRVEVVAEYENRWFQLRIKVGNDTITYQEFKDPILLNKIAKVIESIIQDADLRKEGK